VVAIADNVFNFPLRQYGATFLDSVPGGNRTTITTFRYLVNGDIAIHQKGLNVDWSEPNFRSHSIAVPDSFIIFPTGIKDNRGYTLADTVFHDTTGGKLQTTTIRVVDSVFFQGPATIMVGTEAVSAVQVELQQIVTAVGTIESTVKTHNTLYRYNGWYSPRLGYMVQEQMTSGASVFGRSMTSYTLK
jgi:hypothetical protein